MRHRPLLAAFAMGAALTACAHAPEPVAGPPDYSAIAIQPSVKAGLYAECIAQAAEARTYGRAHDEDTEMVLFVCSGAPARAFYDGLASRSADVGSETSVGGLTYRSTNRVQTNLFGVDYCQTDGRTYACVISLNAGEFLRP